MESWKKARFQAKSHETEKSEGATYGQDITPAILNGFVDERIFHDIAKRLCHPCIQLQQHGADAGHHPGLRGDLLAGDPAGFVGRPMSFLVRIQVAQQNTSFLLTKTR